ncbi:sensor histidine kinase [Mucilaginibacter calamicampi]|uniref:histidine kinase n=1 Tax=Mucilaginibacter calamicampi TaxID=1302352 RepID=A0ABW2YWW1_9SPHI
MKITSKITLLFLGLSTAILLLLNVFILYFEYQFNYRDFFKRLEARTNLTAEINLLPGGDKNAYQEVRNRYLEQLDGEKEYIVKANKNGKYKNPGVPDEFFQDIITLKSTTYRKDNKFFAGKVFTINKDNYIVIATALNAYGLREIEELQRILLMGFAGALIIVFFVGRAFSKYTIAPVRKIIQKVNSITSDNLHLRLDEPRGKDEIAELSHTFNNMLNRLETAFETQNNFVSNASHELRTPLTVINGELELALNDSKTDEKHHQALKVIYDESNKLIQMLNSLLSLAQTGFDGKKQNWQPIRMDELVLEAVESVKKIIPKSNIQVDFSGLPADAEGLYVSGNVNLLNLAATNIISNGCKYSHNDIVDVKLFTQNNSIVFSVTDHGIGIPATEVQHIFEPFFRASNTHDYSGHGVGLPLTLNIIRLHNGTIGIRSEVNSGTEIQVFLPLYRANSN